MSIYGKDHFIKFCITTYLANVLRFYTMRVCKHFAALLYSCMHAHSPNPGDYYPSISI